MSKKEEIFFWSPEELRLREKLIELKEEYGCESLKFETEAEGASFEEIRYYMNLALGQVPIIVKIGGPDARNDIRELSKIGVQGLIAPMVESPYGLENFVTALKEMVSLEQYHYLWKGINIETITTYRQIEAIFSSQEILEIQGISIGRSDLSKSMNLSVDSLEVMEITKEITKKAQKVNLIVSVGGGITPNNSLVIVEKINPERINTRNLGFNLKRCHCITKSIKKALEFELALLEHKAKQVKDHYDLLTKRVNTLKMRLEN
ncbi:aldolase [bacterium]|nr:aldolase [bacterium]MBU0899640.1 aldolase [bacterium]MBU1152747.1 aldolase [bacterium]MBU2599091.1 aldolase [bacterium]